MTISTFITDLISTTLKGILANLAWFILIYWAIRRIVKDIPKWMAEYFKFKRDEEAIIKAKSNLR